MNSAECFAERLILRGKPGTDDHEKQGGCKQSSGNLTENQKGQENPDKRSHSVIGACSCGPKNPLGIDVEIDAEPIGYKAKEKMKEMCTEIFDHIFSHELHSETSHDFSLSDHGLQEKITHLLYHLKDNKGNVLGVLSGASGELFMRYFKEYLSKMFEQYPESIKKDVPRDFALHHLVGSFAEAVKWWGGEKMKTPPEEVAEHYLKLIGYHV